MPLDAFSWQLIDECVAARHEFYGEPEYADLRRWIRNRDAGVLIALEEISRHVYALRDEMANGK